MEKWTSDLIDPQLGKTALITGGTEGVGLEIARELARNGVRVILTTDNILKGEWALRNLRNSIYGGVISYELVDLGDLNSISLFCDKFLRDHKNLDLLIHAADIFIPTKRVSTKQSHEMMFAVNYLAAFMVTVKLFPLLECTPGARIISQTSLEHRAGLMDFFDLEATHYFEPKKAYAQSKLALLIFAKDLDRRLTESHLDIKSIPVHAGTRRLIFFKKSLSFAPFRHRTAMPALFAATSRDALGGHLYGPSGEVECAFQARNLLAAQKLWEISEDMIGQDFILKDMSNVLHFRMRGNINIEG